MQASLSPRPLSVESPGFHSHFLPVLSWAATHTSQAAQHRCPSLPGGFLPSGQPLRSWAPSRPTPLGDPVSLLLRMAHPHPHPAGLFLDRFRGLAGGLCGEARGAVSPSAHLRVNSLGPLPLTKRRPVFLRLQVSHQEFPLAQPHPADQCQPLYRLTEKLLRGA